MKSKKRPRETFGVRINPKIKKEFLASVKEKSLNSCHIIEALLVAWTEGTKKRSPHLGLAPGATLIVNQKFENVIARSRREIKGSIKQYRPEDNCYVKNRGGFAVNGWTYKKPANKSDVNKFGHHISCVCLDCSAAEHSNFL